MAFFKKNVVCAQHFTTFVLNKKEIWKIPIFCLRWHPQRLKSERCVKPLLYVVFQKAIP